MGDKHKGFISLWRCITDNPVWKDANHLKAWIDLLFMANYEDKEIWINNQPLLVRRGQKFTSIRHLATRWGWSVPRVMRYINLLVSADMLYKSVTHNGTLLTIINYDVYQSTRNTDVNTDVNTNVNRGINTDVNTDVTQRIIENNSNNSNNEIKSRRPAWEWLPGEEYLQ